MFTNANGQARYRLELSESAAVPPGQTPYVISISERLPSGAWHLVLRYLYAKRVTRDDEALIMLQMYRRAEIPVEHNFVIVNEYNGLFPEVQHGRN